MFCQNCVDLLQTAYSFKCICIKTEKMLKLYALNCGGSKLMLSDVLQSNCLEQNQIQSASKDGDASLNKYVKEECNNDSFGCNLDLPGDFQTCPEIEIKVNEKEITVEGRQELPLCGSLKNTLNGSSDDERNNCNKDQLDRAYKCNICEKAYHKTKILQNHIRLHFTKTHCKLCGKEFLNVAALKCHLPTVHQIDVTSDDTWRDHIAVIVDVQAMEQALKEHDKLGETDYENISDSYEEHFELHNSSIAPVSYNTCEICGKQFTYKSSLKRHKLIHGVKKTSICNYCQKGFVTKERLKMHISACHPNLICDTCGYTTTRKNNFMDHIRIHTGDKPYTCNLCNKSFAQSSSLGTHMRTVHSTERLFTCEYCSKSFKIKGPLTKHIIEVHLSDKIEKKFICTYCGKKYRLQCSLNSHLKWHKSDRPFSCDICKKTFVNNPALKKHKITHLAEKTHKCEICGKGFHYKYNIKIHMKVHGIQ